MQNDALMHSEGLKGKGSPFCSPACHSPNETSLKMMKQFAVSAFKSIK